MFDKIINRMIIIYIFNCYIWLGVLFCPKYNFIFILNFFFYLIPQDKKLNIDWQTHIINYSKKNYNNKIYSEKHIDLANQAVDKKQLKVERHILLFI